jgi:flagellar hook-basal body complex protein FliE
MKQRTQRTKYSMSPLALSLLIILAFASITFSNHAQLSFAQNNTSFVNSFEKLVKNANNLSQSYHNETEKFAKGQIDNKTMIAITDNYEQNIRT